MNNPISYQCQGPVAVIRMDDGKANALSPTMLGALGEALDRASTEARAALLLGRPGRFSAGFDLKVMMTSPTAAADLVRSGGELFLRLLLHPQPLVVGITGHALAGGILLAACGDLRIATRGDFKLGLNEVSIGLPVPILAHELARLRLDPRRLEEATLRGGTYTPDEAQQVGWVDRVSEPETLEADALKAAEQLVPIAGGHYALTKQTMRGPTVAYIRETMEQNLQAFAALSRR